MSVPELKLLVDKSREKAEMERKFFAAINGIDTSEQGEEEDAVQKIKNRLAAERSGKSQDHYELGLFDIDVEIEE